MNTQDIIKSLSNLEHSLQGVESAKQQVEKTVAAYGATQKQLSALSQEFVTVSNELSTVIAVVRNNQEQLSATISSKIEHLLVQIEDKVAVIGNKASMMNQIFESSCTETAKTIDQSIDAAIASFKGKVQAELIGVSSVLSEFKLVVKDINEDFSRYSLSAISSFKEKGDEMVIEFQKRMGNHLTSFSKLKCELDSVIAQLKNYNNEVWNKIDAETKNINDAISIVKSKLDSIVNIQNEMNVALLTKIESLATEIKPSLFDIDSKLKGIIAYNENYHTELVDGISTIQQGNVSLAEKLTAYFNTVDEKIGAVKEGVSSVSTQLSTAMSRIIDNNKQTILSEFEAVKAENEILKKLVISCLVMTTISMILNLLFIFQ